jgi:basic amino acid/polyamine antiporter, APA family
LDPQFFRTKSIDQLISDAERPEKRLRKSLGWLSLTSLGIGAVIGSGIFTVIGTAIAGQKLEVKSVLNAPLLEYLILCLAITSSAPRRLNTNPN